ncbi:hypothetical protein FEM48_Zijuj02G0179900 [Ziziphus jujuba var. spinosa]|uniref:F-box domain-containing protein n=1 Tax=Ziziphus jujuba var. spinosa TaxID=714518 RepID=A0A978VX54_ZIZJJ|nr:hypothetical protein FEM48_Zijuj02G0179900 [Ziziphus jujuba var. spinosa]
MGMNMATQNDREREIKKLEEEDDDDDDKAVDYFYKLPGDCIANIISFTSPCDACRFSLVSPAFRSAAESNSVWERFLPPDCYSIISRSPSPLPLLSCLSKKDLYFSLCDFPLFIDDGKKSFSLEKWSGKKCYMISARDLLIVWGDTSSVHCDGCHRLNVHCTQNRFPEVAELIAVCWFEIRGKLDVRMLSPLTTYAAYLVFKSTTSAYGFEHLPVETTFGLVGGETSKRNVYLDAERRRRQRYPTLPRRLGRNYRSTILDSRSCVPEGNENGTYPKERKDGWLEIELGDFYCGGDGQDGELEMSVLEVKRGNWKGGFIFEGIEIRPKGV